MTNNDEALTENVIDSADLVNFKKVGSNVLAIRLNNGYYTATANLGYSLKSEDGTFYKITVSVFTKYLTANLAEDEELTAVSIALANFDEKFSGIESNGEWTTYTFYLDPSEANTTYVTLSLGSEEQPISGTAFFGDIEFSTIDQTEFDNAAIKSDFVKVLETVVEDTEDDTDTDDDTNNTTNTNWIYYIPSILFAVAIVIAIVGVMARKIRWKKPVKKSKNAYDRNTTVSKQVLMRKATTLRENKLMELNKDLSTLTAERTQYETEYKQDLATLRDMKIKRANPSDISKLEKEMKKSQKHSASIGVSINNIEAEIEYTKSEAYINSLMKKLAREGIEKEEK